MMLVFKLIFSMKSNIVQYYRKIKNTPNVVIVENGLIIRQLQAHQESITCMSKIENPRVFITGSIDKHVKVCSHLGE